MLVDLAGPPVPAVAADLMVEAALEAGLKAAEALPPEWSLAEARHSPREAGHPQALDDGVVQCRPHLLNRRVLARWMHSVGQKHHVDFAV